MCDGCISSGFDLGLRQPSLRVYAVAWGTLRVTLGTGGRAGVTVRRDTSRLTSTIMTAVGSKLLVNVEPPQATAATASASGEPSCREEQRLAFDRGRSTGRYGAHGTTPARSREAVPEIVRLQTKGARKV